MADATRPQTRRRRSELLKLNLAVELSRPGPTGSTSPYFADGEVRKDRRTPGTPPEPFFLLVVLGRERLTALAALQVIPIAARRTPRQKRRRVRACLGVCCWRSRVHTNTLNLYHRRSTMMGWRSGTRVKHPAPGLIQMQHRVDKGTPRQPTGRMWPLRAAELGGGPDRKLRVSLRWPRSPGSRQPRRVATMTRTVARKLPAPHSRARKPTEGVLALRLPPPVAAVGVHGDVVVVAAAQEAAAGGVAEGVGGVAPLAPPMRSLAASGASYPAESVAGCWWRGKIRSRRIG